MDTHPSPPRTELDLITAQELARHLKICRRPLYNWRVSGLIPCFKMGKAVRFRWRMWRPRLRGCGLGEASPRKSFNYMG